MIHKNTPSVDYSLWLKRWDNQLNEPTNSIKVAKDVVLMTYCYQKSTLDIETEFVMIYFLLKMAKSFSISVSQ